MKRKIIFIGGIWQPDEEDEIIRKSKGNIQAAANVLQWNLISGFDHFCERPVTIISERFLGAYPKLYQDLYIAAGKFNHSSNAGHQDFQVEFLNLPIYKHYSRLWHIKKYVRHVCQQNSEEQIFVIGYSMTYSITKALLYAKQVNQSVRTCLIIPDLPEYMNLGNDRGAFFSSLKNYSTNMCYNDLKKIDSFVLLTEHMADRIPCSKPYTVVEGVAPEPTNFPPSIYKEQLTKNVVYTGTLGLRYGISELVDAFCKIQDNALRLVICGAGDGVSYITNAAKKDSRIQFLGIVSNAEARKLQQEAYLLVNPRSSNEEYTKFSFPSKTMEYMVSGRPVLMYKLKGIPDEYDKYLYYVEEDLAVSLEKVLALPEEELEAKGKDAFEFIRDKKNKYAQTEKMVKLLLSLK